MKQNRMSRFMFILGCVVASILYWSHAMKRIRITPPANTFDEKLKRVDLPIRKPILNEQVDHIHFSCAGLRPTYWDVENITEPEMIAAMVEVLNHWKPRPRFAGPVTGTVSSELIVHFKPVRGVTPEPVGGQLHRDLFYNYGVPMWEMMQRLGKFRAERARQLFTKRAGEIVKIEWINPTKPPFKESTEDKRNIASIVKQLKNVDERCFAYTDSVGVCPLQLFSGTERLH